MLTALIFDVDGTLAETEELHRAAFNIAFGKAGLDWHWDRALYGALLRIAGGKERIAHYLAIHRPDIADEAEALIAGLHREKTALYEELVAGGALALRPGVAALLHAASAQGITLAIATTTSLPNVTALLRATLGAEHPFAVIAAGDRVAAKKPAPDIYLDALRQLSCDAKNCLAIEDSGIGVRAARAAEITVVATPSAYFQDDDFSGAAKVVDTLAGLAGGDEGPIILDRLRAIHALVN